MDCMLFTFENRIPLMGYGGVHGVDVLLLFLNSFNKTKSSIFPMQAMLPEEIDTRIKT